MPLGVRLDRLTFEGTNKYTKNYKDFGCYVTMENNKWVLNFHTAVMLIVVELKRNRFSEVIKKYFYHR